MTRTEAKRRVIEAARGLTNACPISSGWVHYPQVTTLRKALAVIDALTDTGEAEGERLADPHFVLQFMDDETVLCALELDDFQVTLYPDQSRLSITLSGQQLSDIRDHIALRDRIISGEDARVVRLAQERDDATRRAEALEAEVGRLQQQLVRMTDRWHAAVEMGVEADKTISALSAPPAADHTERARELYCSLVFTISDEAEDTSKIAAALVAAERAGAEQMRERAQQAVELEAKHWPTDDQTQHIFVRVSDAIRTLPLPGEE